MKYLTWNYLRNTLLTLIYAALIAMLGCPWLERLTQFRSFPLAKGSAWLFFMTANSVFLLEKAALREEGDGFYLGLAIVIPLALMVYWHLPLVIFAPLILLLLLLGIRFLGYPWRREFFPDWALASLVFLSSFIFTGNFSLEDSLSKVLLFFILGVLAIILWNTELVEQKWTSADYKRLGSNLGIFVVLVCSLALTLTAILSPVFWQQVLNLFWQVYWMMAKAFLFFIVQPFAWLLASLFNWADKLEKQPLTLNVSEWEPEHLDQLLGEGGLDSKTLQIANKFGWVLFAIFFAVAIWLIFRKLRQNRLDQRAGLRRRELRESVFSGSEALEDLREVWQALVKPFHRLRKARRFDDKDPILMIRSLYSRFAQRACKRYPGELGATPREFAEKIQQERENVPGEDIWILTELYNAARYGEKGDHTDVERAQQALRRLRNFR